MTTPFFIMLKLSSNEREKEDFILSTFKRTVFLRAQQSSSSEHSDNIYITVPTFSKSRQSDINSETLQESTKGE